MAQNQDNGMSVLSRPSPSPEAAGPKSDQWALHGHFAVASLGGAVSAYGTDRQGISLEILMDHEYKDKVLASTHFLRRDFPDACVQAHMSTVCLNSRRLHTATV
eukprot:COSAG02_NODE_1329_length_13218_cov_16.986432_9_plen_104_part_00